MPTFHCSAILFDLDGVLIDSTATIARRWAAWAEERDLDPGKVLEVIHGRRTLEVIEIVAPHLDAAAETVRIEQSIADDADPAISGAPELLQSLPDNGWCVVTSGTRNLAIARMRLAGLPLPRVLIGADDVNKGKPDPEPYLKGAELLGFPPSQCIVVEDAVAGVRAAHAGKMDVIALSTTYTSEELKEADAVVSDIKQIRVTHSQGKLRVEI
jgi:mannitol-1-/sugar-/sorbitol-6-phosphatase